MTDRKLLSIDLSTSSTGLAVFDVKSKNLLYYGNIKPRSFTKFNKYKNILLKLYDLSEKIIEYIKNNELENSIIVIEEVNSHKNRIGGKTLDMAHGILWHMLEMNFPGILDRVVYEDTDGAIGWRTLLGLKFTAQDKIYNSGAKKTNKLLKKSQKLVILTKKHLSQRYVNKVYKTTFNIDENKSHEDICDAIAMGSAYLNKKGTPFG